MSTSDQNPLRFSLRGLLAFVTVIALAGGFSVMYPRVATLTGAVTLFLFLNFAEPGLYYYPRATLLGLASLGIAFIGSGLYASATTGDFDLSFVGRMIFGSLLLLLTWLGYVFVSRRKP